MTRWGTAVLLGLLFASPPGKAQDGLKIVVIQGEDAVNVIQRKTAVAPIVEVRDRNDLPVAGATVTFTIIGDGAAFPAGAHAITIATNSVGRAAAASLTPVADGAVQIEVSASAQGVTAFKTITQTNVVGAAGGVSGLAVGVVGAVGAAGAVAVAVAGGGDNETSTPSAPGTTTGSSSTPTAPAVPTPTPSPTPVPPTNRTPVISSTTASRTTVLLGTDTVVSFAVSASDADGDTLNYEWNFGDGTTATGPSVSHVYRAEGVFLSRVVVRDQGSSIAGEVLISARSLTGNWSNLSATVYRIVQSGTTLSGTYRSELGFSDGSTLQYECPITGAVRQASPQVTLENVPCPVSRGTVLRSVLRLDPNESIDRLSGSNEVNGQVLSGNYFYVRQ